MVHLISIFPLSPLAHKVSKTFKAEVFSNSRQYRGVSRTAHRSIGVLDMYFRKTFFFKSYNSYSTDVVIVHTS